MRVAVYPGSFDPITNGHFDIIERARAIFDVVIVAVLENTNKKYLFSLEERIKMLQETLKNIPNIRIDHFDGLLVDYVRKQDAQVIVRGLRAISDFEYEFQMALMNRNLDPTIETVFLMTSDKYAYLSSSMVKEAAKFGAYVGDLVPSCVEKQLSLRFKKHSLKEE